MYEQDLRNFRASFHVWNYIIVMATFSTKTFKPKSNCRLVKWGDNFIFCQFPKLKIREIRALEFGQNEISDFKLRVCISHDDVVVLNSWLSQLQGSNDFKLNPIFCCLSHLYNGYLKRETSRIMIRNNAEAKEMNCAFIKSMSQGCLACFKSTQYTYIQVNVTNRRLEMWENTNKQKINQE